MNVTNKRKIVMLSIGVGAELMIALLAAGAFGLHLPDSVVQTVSAWVAGLTISALGANVGEHYTASRAKNNGGSHADRG